VLFLLQLDPVSRTCTYTIA